MKRISYLETCHPRNLLSGIHAFVLRLDSRLRGNDSEVVLLHASRFTRCVCFIVLLFSLHASLFTFHAHAKLENGMKASVVIGQSNFESNAVGVSARQFNNPYMTYPYKGKLFVSDYINHRVLIYNKTPATNGESADIVLGQSDFVSNSSGTARTKFNGPGGIVVINDRLVIADWFNSRVLVWNQIPTTNNQPADVVLGQVNFANSATGLSQTEFANPWDVTTDGNRLIVSDANNERVLIWNKLPTTNNAPADVVLGQPDFTTNTPGVTASKMDLPYGLATDGKSLYVVELSNNRVLVWHSIPTSSSVPADLVLGQKDFVSNVVGTTRANFNNPSDILILSNQLLVSDYGNRRILVWKTLPTQNSQLPDAVIGQSDFNSAVNIVDRSHFNRVWDLQTDGRNLFVGDWENNRILIFDIADSNFDDLGPQFSQGKAVVGKVFWDFDGDGRQDGGIS